MRQLYPAAICAALVAVTAGCESMAVTAFGVGASAGVSQTLNGVVYRTFTYPVDKVRVAAADALKEMGMGIDRRDGPIRAHANGRSIEIEFDAVSANSTRMRAEVRSGGLPLFYDAATGREIVAQTEKVLVEATARAAAPAAPAPPLGAVADPVEAPTVIPIAPVPPPTVIAPAM